MSDNNAVPNLPGLSAARSGNFKTGNQDSAVILDKDQPIPFTYPEGFNAVANSLQFLPEEARAQTLTGLVLGILLM
jgi:hypothetical protein